SFDERMDAAVAPGRYEVHASEPEWVVPSPGLPAGITLGAANNNVSVARHGGRTYLAWRTAPTHFASSASRLYVLSREHGGAPWTLEMQVATGRDLREPFLLSTGE